MFVLHAESSWTSPWVASVYVTLSEKGLPFSTSLSMIRPGVGAVRALRDRTLTGTAPVLEHHGVWIAESLAIVEYLEEVAPVPRVLPAEVADRARARQLMIWMRCEHQALHRERPLEHVIYQADPSSPPLSSSARTAADQLVHVASLLQLDASGCAFGGTFGVVDVELALALARLTHGELPAQLQDYLAAVRTRPSVRAFLEHPRPPNLPSS
jgi:glutathione S-transferase